MKRRRLLTPLLMLLASAILPAQRYSFKVYDQQAGLASLNIRVLLQDRSGFLWVGTDNGLYRYDGSRFRVYSTSDGLASPQVEVLYESPDGTLWAGGVQGLTRLDGERFVKVDLSPRKAVFSIASDTRGRIYIGTSRGLLTGSFAAGKLTALQPLASVPQETVKAIVLTGPGEGWLCSGRRILRLRGGQAETGPPGDFQDDAWEDIKADAEGGVWARSRTKLIHLAKGASRFERRDGGLPAAATAGRIAVGRDGRVWIPTVRGLARRTAAGWETVGRSRGLPSNSVQCAFQDREGSIWVGMNGAGLARWLGYPHWESWTEAEGLGSETVWALRRDATGTLWAGGDNGLSRFDEAGRRWVELHLRGVSGVQASHVTPAPDGALWVGQTGGLVRVDPGRRSTQFYGKEAGFPFPWISSLAVDAQNRVWAGTPNGLYLGIARGGRYSFERENLRLERGLDFHYGSLIDRRGRLWCGTWGGLLCYTDGKWTRYQKQDGLAAGRVSNIVEGLDGTLWLSYMDAAGVSQLLSTDGKLRWRHFRQKDGLRSERVFSLGRDSRGWIWAGTDQGADVWDGSRWRNFDRSDGMASDDCNGNSFWSDTDGSVWIGAGRGVSRVLIPPGGIPPRPKELPVRLVSVEVGGRPVSADDTITVPWSHRSLRASFAALSFFNEDSVRFRYRVAGLDARWTEAQNREVHLPGLPAGSYRLEVEAATRTGEWSGTAGRFAFTVRPAWWRTWWFTALAAALAAALARLAWLWRVRSLLRRQRELEEAVQDRTRSLALAKEGVERERDIVRDQKGEIERLLQETKQASVLKDQFLANMSHELRTPMNGIIGMTDLTLETPLTQEQRGFLQQVRGASASLLAIIEDVLDFSSAQSGKLTLDDVAFDVEDVVGASLATVSPEAREKGLELRCTVAPDVPRRAVGDPSRLRQVLVNLLSNAVKFTERGKVEVEVTAEAEGGSVRLHFVVSDTGIGIPKEKHGLIFEPFSQADGSLTRRHGGTGLGLTLCTRFVELMGGRIRVESAPGAGSRFHFTARVGREAAKPARAPSPVPSPTHTRELAVLSILLAEDNPLNQKLAVRLLQKRGHTVVTAENGCEAVEAFARQPFDAVLMDVQMPVMGGFEATAEIRARERSGARRTPIIAVTAHALQGDRERCLEAGMDDYVAKPIRPDELYAAIERHVAPAARG